MASYKVRYSEEEAEHVRAMSCLFQLLLELTFQQLHLHKCVLVPWLVWLLTFSPWYCLCVDTGLSNTILLNTTFLLPVEGRMYLELLPFRIHYLWPSEKVKEASKSSWSYKMLYIYTDWRQRRSLILQVIYIHQLLFPSWCEGWRGGTTQSTHNGHEDVVM